MNTQSVSTKEQVTDPDVETSLGKNPAGTDNGHNHDHKHSHDHEDVEKDVPVVRGSEPFPDGGLRTSADAQAWLVVLGAFLTAFSGFGICAAVGGFQSVYRAGLLSDYSESQVAWITSVQAFFNFAPSIVTGVLFDKYGHKPLVAIGGFLLALGFCMLSLSTQYYQIFLCHVVLIAGGANLMFIVPLGCVGQWFDKKRGMAFGIMSCGSSLGALSWPLVLANLPPKVGFAWTCRIMALIAATCSVGSFFLLKTRLPPKPKGSFFYFQAFRSKEYCLVVLAFAVWCFGYFVFQTYIGRYGEAYGLGHVAPYLLILTNGVSAVGRLAAGFFADKLGLYNTVIVGNFLVALFFWMWLACRDTASCIALATCVGISAGAFISLQAPLVTMTAPNMNLGGTMIGQALGLQAIVMIISSPIAGALLGVGTIEQIKPRFTAPIILCSVMVSLAVGFVIWARLHRSRRLGSKI